MIKVSRDQEAILKIDGDSEQRNQILKEISNKSFSFSVSNDQINGNIYNVSFDIIAKDLNNS